jgi:hypothetical protein
MAAVDVRIDEVLRRRVKPMRGFQLLSFVRVHDAYRPDTRLSIGLG